ncbi:hypothetical protein L484_026329 [Morus notabilis]|uniref:Thioredoxin-like fold domain-containing protein n=1 Tax=Morus notabilis TaxID=981085 RepID=W9QXT9_9ROSA|nr:hypothetical protein L484_026329 [Morus notabilis]
MNTRTRIFGQNSGKNSKNNHFRVFGQLGFSGKIQKTSRFRVFGHLGRVGQFGQAGKIQKNSKIRASGRAIRAHPIFGQFSGRAVRAWSEKFKKIPADGGIRCTTKLALSLSANLGIAALTTPINLDITTPLPPDQGVSAPLFRPILIFRAPTSRFLFVDLGCMVCLQPVIRLSFEAIVFRIGGMGFQEAPAIEVLAESLSHFSVRQLVENYPFRELFLFAARMLRWLDQIPYIESGDYVAYNNEKGGVIERIKKHGIIDLDNELYSVLNWISTKAMLTSWLADAIKYELWVGSDGSFAQKIYCSDLPWPIGKVLFLKQVYNVKEKDTIYHNFESGMYILSLP